MSPIATIFAYLGGAIFVVLFIWKSRDFYKEALNDARANKLPPQKCITVAITYTTLLWLLILGSFVVLGVTAIKAGPRQPFPSTLAPRYRRHDIHLVIC